MIHTNVHHNDNFCNKYEVEVVSMYFQSEWKTVVPDQMALSEDLNIQHFQKSDKSVFGRTRVKFSMCYVCIR